MALVELVMPKMGESITEATILRWLKKVGDSVAQDETILEIATDKVDTEVPSPEAGIITEILFEENAVVEVGKKIAVINTSVDAVTITPEKINPPIVQIQTIEKPTVEISQKVPYIPELVEVEQISANGSANGKYTDDAKSGRFYSPLVKTMAKEEGISVAELETVNGTGQGGRVSKTDLLAYLETKKSNIVQTAVAQPKITSSGSVSGATEIIEMDRMRRLIAEHMVMSVQTAPHVTSFVEVDVTNMVQWRQKAKTEFQKKYNENLTYTPLFFEAVCRALEQFPYINASVDGTKIILKKDINIGMAAALPNGNLIVPVLKSANFLNLAGLSQRVNDLATRARNNQLKPDEVQGGTFTITNVGTYGSLMGTPIINQPQVAILAIGIIKKKPAVIETPSGDVIAIRHFVFLSLSYDHRIVDGAMGSSFLSRIGKNLEAFDPDRVI